MPYRVLQALCTALSKGLRFFKQGGNMMKKEKYAENASMIIELANGMSRSQWRRLSHVIEEIYDRLEKQVEFETPEEIELLKRQNFIG